MEEKRDQEIQKLRNEKYLNKILEKEQMLRLREVVSMDFSRETLEKLKNYAQEFVEEQKGDLEEKMRTWVKERKRGRKLRTEIREKEDLKDKLTIVKIIRRPK